VMLVMDVSGSEQFGTASRFKGEVASELATVLAMSAVRNNDKVGVIFFTDQVEYVVPPKKGKRHAMRLVRDFLAFTPKGTQTDFTPALQQMDRTLHHHSIVFLVSDFMAHGYERALRILTQRHDVIAVSINDPSEQVLPDVGVARLLDPETKAYIEVDTSDAAVRKAYVEHVNTEVAARRKLLGRLGVDEIPLVTAQSSVEPLLKFFRNRENSRRR
ncbi:MAG TPA: VWA domain-containing protein, partial [Gemmatimonadaceae bacterium]|nr:VWA domain-containing protein [Gemmatimonadaceae bacterium]